MPLHPQSILLVNCLPIQSLIGLAKAFENSCSCHSQHSTAHMQSKPNHQGISAGSQCAASLPAASVRMTPAVQSHQQLTLISLSSRSKTFWRSLGRAAGEPKPSSELKDAQEAVESSTSSSPTPFRYTAPEDLQSQHIPFLVSYAFLSGRMLLKARFPARPFPSDRQHPMTCRATIYLF